MTKDQLTQVIQNVIPDSNTDVDAWQLVLDQCKDSPSIFHLLNTVQYYVAYFSENNAVNLSIVLYNNREPVGIMPLMAHQNKFSDWVLTSNGVEIVEPIFIPTLARKVKKRLESQLAELVYALSNELNIECCQFTNIGYRQLSSWYLMWVEKAIEVFSTHHLLVDLSLSLDEIRLKFRKSFKPLINKGLREWKVEVHERVSEDLFERFRLLHKEVAGRSTRPIDSWKEHLNQVLEKEAFLVTVSGEKDDLIGSGFFVFSKNTSLYAVGSYNRNFYDKPLGHIVQMKAIETLKNKGLRWYEIGQKHLNIDKVPATEKELSISYFKEGFSTQVVARQHLIINMDR
jgi:FemAB family protein